MSSKLMPYSAPIVDSVLKAWDVLIDNQPSSRMAPRAFSVDG